MVRTFFTLTALHTLVACSESSLRKTRKAMIGAIGAWGDTQDAALAAGTGSEGPPRGLRRQLPSRHDARRDGGDVGLPARREGCRPPGVRPWDLYGAANDIDIDKEWAMAAVHGRPSQGLSRRYSAGIVAPRPECDGRIVGCEGVEAIQWRVGGAIIDMHLPAPGTATQLVEAGYIANAWIRLKHPDYDELRGTLDVIGRTVKVRARSTSLFARAPSEHAHPVHGGERIASVPRPTLSRGGAGADA